jgi:hypothetical protein
MCHPLARAPLAQAHTSSTPVTLLRWHRQRTLALQPLSQSVAETNVARGTATRERVRSPARSLRRHLGNSGLERRAPQSGNPRQRVGPPQSGNLPRRGSPLRRGSPKAGRPNRQWSARSSMTRLPTFGVSPSLEDATPTGLSMPFVGPPASRQARRSNRTSLTSSLAIFRIY